MENPPLTSDEKAAADATRDIAANVTGGREWKPYDTKYVRGRILRAIRDAIAATPQADTGSQQQPSGHLILPAGLLDEQS
jgi:hypothetical protein